MYVSGAKLCHTCLVSNFSRPSGTEARKVVKTRSNYFSTILTGNDRNCTTKCVIMFGVPNVVIWVRFQLWLCRLVPGPGKVVKIRPKHFFVVLMRNDKNCTPKSVSLFRALNRLICVPFSTFHCPIVPGPEKVVKISPRPLLSVRIEND